MAGFTLLLHVCIACLSGDLGNKICGEYIGSFMETSASWSDIAELARYIRYNRNGFAIASINKRNMCSQSNLKQRLKPVIMDIDRLTARVAKPDGIEVENILDNRPFFSSAKPP